MNTVDRVMRAYCRVHDLSDAQAKVVRAELAKFIDELTVEIPISPGSRNEAPLARGNTDAFRSGPWPRT